MAFETLSEAQVDAKIAEMEDRKTDGLRSVRYGDTSQEMMSIDEMDTVLASLYQRKRQLTSKPLVKQYRIYGTRGY